MMIGKIKKLELENSKLKRNIKSYGFGMFALGAMMGATLILLKEEKLQIDKLLTKFEHMKNKTFGDFEAPYDEETMEILEEEKDNFE
ncbi:MAG: hypothetical protein JXR88_00685 [Clostridia bacterium]|nr:hypothetical protein [Clostridia bacterium]